jgi:hypothetical protein
VQLLRIGSISAMAIFRRRVRLSVSRSVFRLGENTCLDEMKARQARHYPSDCQRVYAVFKSAKGVHVDR